MNIRTIIRIMIMVLASLTLAQAQVPGLLNYQGAVAVNGTNFTGTGHFQFALVDGTGTTTYWSNGVSTVNVEVTDGLYTKLLGDTGMNPIPASVFANSDVRLRVWFSDGVHGLQQLSPDQRLAAVGYTFNAAQAQTATVAQTALNVSFNGTVAGQSLNIGQGNTLSGAYATIAGGVGNIANSQNATIAGGFYNTASAPNATVGGGDQNTASNQFATVAGGFSNTAGGIASFAAGSQARALHNGAFVWADNTATEFASTANNQFLIRASGGVGIGTNAPASALHVNGTVTASGFNGSGAGLTGVTAAAMAIPPGMALIPAGAFTMGDTLDGMTDAVPVSVTVSAFYMDINLVSLAQWQSVYFWAKDHGYGFRIPYFVDGRAANNPAQQMSWREAVKWCNARSQQAGLTPVYYTDAGLTQIYINGEIDAVYANWNAKGYRLPTEAEWEKAARGGLSGQRFPWGNTITENLANYGGMTATYSYDLGPDGYNAAFTNGATAYTYTSPVGFFAPNGYGLYDMAGNVFQWCWDWYGTPYAGGIDPRGPVSGGARVLRGGSCITSPSYCRTARRNPLPPAGVNPNVGFRTVLIP